MRRSFFGSTVVVLFSLAVMLLLSGCFEYAEEYTINEDGSGSFLMDIGMGTMLASMMELGGEVEDDENPFQEMKGRADKINTEGDPTGIVTGAEFSQYDEGDMKHSVFTLSVSDMTKLIDSVEAEWWADAPGSGAEGEAPEEPFRIEKLPNGNLLFIKEITVPGGENAADDTEDEGGDMDADGEEGDSESSAVSPHNGLASLGLITPAYGQEEEAAGEDEGESAEADDDDDENHEDGDVDDDDDENGDDEDHEGGDVDDDEAFDETMEEMLSELGEAFTEGLEEGFEEDGEATEGEEEDFGGDMFGEDMMKSMFAGKFYTVTLNAPIIVETNGTIVFDEVSADAGDAAKSVGAKLQTVEWKIPMADLMGGEGYYLECSAEIKLKPKKPGVLGKIMSTETDDGSGASPLLFIVLGIVVIAGVVLLIVFLGRKDVKPKVKE
ncbi:hypothetical protein J7K50_06800 [bacterium]|nr:hypothetical protein [bacterium]